MDYDAPHGRQGDEVSRRHPHGVSSRRPVWMTRRTGVVLAALALLSHSVAILPAGAVLRSRTAASTAARVRAAPSTLKELTWSGTACVHDRKLWEGCCGGA